MLMDLKETGRNCAMLHLMGYAEKYGIDNLHALIEYNEFDTDEYREKERKIKEKGYRMIDESMFGIGGDEIGRVLIYLKNEVEK